MRLTHHKGDLVVMGCCSSCGKETIFTPLKDKTLSDPEVIHEDEECRPQYGPRTDYWRLANCIACSSPCFFITSEDESYEEPEVSLRYFYPLPDSAVRPPDLYLLPYKVNGLLNEFFEAHKLSLFGGCAMLLRASVELTLIDLLGPYVSAWGVSIFWIAKGVHGSPCMS